MSLHRCGPEKAQHQTIKTMGIEKNPTHREHSTQEKSAKVKLKLMATVAQKKCSAPNHQNSDNWKECSVKDAKSKYEINSSGGYSE